MLIYLHYVNYLLASTRHPGNRIHKRRGRMIALIVLRALAYALEKWEELAETLQREMDLSDEDFEAKIAFKFRWSEVQETRLENVEDAVRGFAEVLEWNSDHEGARVAGK